MRIMFQNHYYLIIYAKEEKWGKIMDEKWKENSTTNIYYS